MLGGNSMTPSDVVSAAPANTLAILARVPEAARIYEMIRARCDDLGAVARHNSEQLRERILEAERWRARIRQLENDNTLRALSANERATHPAMVDAQRRLATIEGERARLQERGNARQMGWLAMRQATEDYAAGLAADAALIHHPAPTVALAPGETPATALEAVRGEISRLAADRRAIETAPIKSTAALSIIRAELDRRTADGAPSLLGLVEAGGRIEWPTERLVLSTYGLIGDPAGVGRATGDVFATLDFLLWLMRPEIERRLAAELAEVADDPAALTEDERRSRLSANAVARLELERREVVLLDQVPEDLAVPRPDMDVRAVLLIDGPTPKR